MKLRYKILLGGLVVSLACFAYIAHAASSGPLGPSTTIDDASVGTQVWSNPNNAQVSDAVYATVVTSKLGVQSTHALKATNFGFSIPAGATINGILVEIQRKGDGGPIHDSTVQIVKSTGAYGSTNKASATNWPLSEAYASYGGGADLWGETWATTDINNSNFGVGLQAIQTADPSADTGSVDYIRITVTYTIATFHSSVTLRQSRVIVGNSRVIIQ